MKRYFLVSLQHSVPENVVFWRANDCGYTTIPFLAGIYTEEEILDRIEYYTEDAVPVPIEDFAQAGLKVTVKESAIKKYGKQWKEKHTKNALS